MSRRRNPRAIAKYVIKGLPMAVTFLILYWVVGILGREEVFRSNMRQDLEDLRSSVAAIDARGSLRLEYLVYRDNMMAIAIADALPESVGILNQTKKIGEYIEIKEQSTSGHSP